MACLLAVEFKIQTTAKRRHNANVCASATDVLFLSFALGWVGEVLEHEFFLHIELAARYGKSSYPHTSSHNNFELEV